MYTDTLWINCYKTSGTWRNYERLRNISKIKFPGVIHSEMSGWFVDLKILQSCIRDGEFSDQPSNCQIQPTSAEAKKTPSHCTFMAIYWIQIIKQNTTKRKSMGTFRTAFSPTPSSDQTSLFSRWEFATLGLANQTGTAAFIEQRNTEFNVNRLRDDGKGKVMLLVTGNKD
jgi:hypothetical protein